MINIKMIKEVMIHQKKGGYNHYLDINERHMLMINIKMIKK